MQCVFRQLIMSNDLYLSRCNQSVRIEIKKGPHRDDLPRKFITQLGTEKEIIKFITQTNNQEVSYVDIYIANQLRTYLTLKKLGHDKTAECELESKVHIKISAHYCHQGVCQRLSLYTHSHSKVLQADLMLRTFYIACCGYNAGSMQYYQACIVQTVIHGWRCFVLC